MKKIVTILLTIAILMAAAGCGGNRTTKAYDAFSVSYPQTWTAVTDTAIADTQENSPFLYVTVPTVSDYTSYFYIIKMNVDSIESIDAVDQDFGDAWAQLLSDQLGITMSCDDVSYKTFGSIKGAVVTFTGKTKDVSITYMEQLIPTKEEWYVFTYLIINDKDESDMKKVMNSVTFQ